MGLLDNNNIRTTPRTGLEGSDFNLLASTDDFDLFHWDSSNTGKKLAITYADIFAWYDDDNLYILKGKITDTPTKVVVNSTNFPNLRTYSGGTYPKIERVIACPGTFAYKQNSVTYGHVSSIGNTEGRICVIFDNGQIYHNYPSCYDDCDFYNGKWRKSDIGAGEVKDLFDKFDESCVWDLPDRKSPVKTNTGNDATLIATGVYYYNPALPDNCYEMHPAISQSNGYGNTVGFPATNSVNPISSGTDIGLRARFWRPNMDNAAYNSFSYMGGYVADNMFTMIGTYRNNVGSDATRICVFGTQDCGRSWYCMYEFAGRERIKRDTSYYDADNMKGIPLAQSGSTSSGVYTIKRRTLVIPTSDDKEPMTKFEIDAPINVSSIVGNGSTVVITTANSHGLVNGDVVIVDFQSGVSANNRAFDWMVNSTASTISGGNGVLIQVSNKTDTTFEAVLYVHNPNNNLPVRHIHALNRCKDGVSVSCGEFYGKGGWVLYNPVRAADAFGGYNIADIDVNTFVRLNSTASSIMRPLGVLVKQEADDTYCYVGIDSAEIDSNDVELPEGRTDTFKHNSCGVWKIKLSDFDDMKNKGVLKYPAVQTCFGFQQILNAMVFTGQFGDFAISYDNGESWSNVSFPLGNWGQNCCHFSGPTYDRKFSIDNMLIQLKK